MDWFIERAVSSVTEPLKYFGTDWLAVICTGVYLWRVGDRKRDAFIWGGAGNVFFIALNFMIASVPGIVFNALFLALNGRAFVRWRGDGARETGFSDVPEPPG